eukprot:TRINITY_DN31030_c0_g1_i5.p1 TRINITY_DN31030_c0_g1~~TRINITY_DN31030_c0_g1_i5.p1  ORF type:complete len:527 (-),score=68.24 TRINITY_DN31030_c0_g1_i5:393-1973(-)
MVRDVMTLVERMFMLDANLKLNFENMFLIYKSGYTRIPVYEGELHNIVGILFVKDLILVDPDDEIDLKTVLTFHGSKSVKYILDTTSLKDVFRMFKMSYSHIMIAVKLQDMQQLPKGGNINNQTFLATAKKEVTGIITLEDVLEEVIQAEIVDESDVYVSNESQKRVKHGRERPDISAFMTLFDHRIRDSTRLSSQELQAVSAFLIANVKEFKPFLGYEYVLTGLIRQGEVVEVEDYGEEPSGDLDRLLALGPNSSRNSHLDGHNDAQHRQSDLLNHKDDHSISLYQKGQVSDKFSLILQGKLLVYAGNEMFMSELGPWNYLGASALSCQQKPYLPDYDAITYGQCRVLRIARGEYDKAYKVRGMDYQAAKRIFKSAITSNSQEEALCEEVQKGQPTQHTHEYNTYPNTQQQPQEQILQQSQQQQHCLYEKQQQSDNQDIQLQDIQSNKQQQQQHKSDQQHVQFTSEFQLCQELEDVRNVASEKVEVELEPLIDTSGARVSNGVFGGGVRRGTDSSKETSSWSNIL